MNSKLTIQERLKDLRVNNRKLTLEQPAQATGLSRAALGNYETNDFKDISCADTLPIFPAMMR